MSYKPKTVKPKMMRTFDRRKRTNEDVLQEMARNRRDSTYWVLMERAKKEIDEYLKGELMNRFVGIGRLVRDPELRYTSANKAVCNFTLAIDKEFSKDKKQEYEAKGWPTADFPRVIVWGALGETYSKILRKGMQCAVGGRIQTGSYKDKDGKTVFTTEILAENVEFLSKASSGSGYSPQSKAQDDNFFGENFEEVEDDGRIPF